jgi:hypothetical protein
MVPYLSRLVLLGCCGRWLPLHDDPDDQHFGSGMPVPERDESGAWAGQGNVHP